jgi:TetR/AcrR family transcriptional repressor of nem operon
VNVTERLSHKERTRARIIEEAAKAMRQYGPEGIGVAALMKRAGLTHGGFYAHFENRDDLVAQAIRQMFQDDYARMQARLAGVKDPAGRLAAFIDNYLSDRARLSVDRACPLPTLTGEAARMPQAARERFDEGIEGFRSTVRDAIAATGAKDPDELASSVAAEMVGAMALARATRDDAKASELLARSREQLKRRLGLVAND